MKNLALSLAILAAAGFSLPSHAELASIDLAAGDNAVPTPCRAVLLHAMSTNASGTVTLKRVASHSVSWTEWQTVTNVTYSMASSNLTYTVTNAVVSAGATNYVAATVTTNIPYRTATSVRVERLSVPRRVDVVATNDLATVALASGFAATNAFDCVFAPGDRIVGSGSAFSGGRVRLIVDR